VVPGKYAFHGQLKYQACDKAAFIPAAIARGFSDQRCERFGGSEKEPGQSPIVHW
jgi:hypothetical protein